MWKVLQVATIVCVAALLMQSDHYKAIQHKFYQIWDSIEELRGQGHGN